MIDKSGTIYVAGHRGMLGSAIVRELQRKGYANLVTRTSAELDLTQQSPVTAFFNEIKPDYVVLAAARVGGIAANIQFPAGFLYENLCIQNNVIHSAYETGAKKLIFIGSSCIYPRESPQPMKEEYLLTGKLEPTNEAYAIAKIAGLKMTEYYQRQYGMDALSVMPCNLYGTNDSFDPGHSHVLSALVKKFTDAVANGDKEVTLWGTGNARREFMHVDDCAAAIVFLFEKKIEEPFINIGSGTDVSIKELGELVAEKTGFTGKINFDTSKPDGMPRKCMDVSKLAALGFRSRISLPDGITQTISEYIRIKEQQ